MFTVINRERPTPMLDRLVGSIIWVPLQFISMLGIVMRQEFDVMALRFSSAL